MNNDYLRLNNSELKSDKSVNIYSAKHSKVKNVESNLSKSALSIIIDEVYSSGDSVEFINENTVEKPKILDSIIFSFVFLLVIIAITFVCTVTKDLILILCLSVLLAMFVPVSLLYFFYRLDVRGKLKFSSLIYYMLLGGVFLICIDFVFKTSMNQAFNDYLSNVSVRCLVELIGIFLISFFIVRGKFNRARTSAILITCAVSAGFALTKSLYGNFMSLFVDADVETNLGFFDYGMRLGAIINHEGFIGLSFDNLLSTASSLSFLQPMIFMFVAIIFIDVLETEDWSITKRAISSIFAFIFCATAYILTSVYTSFSVLSLLYKSLSIIFVLYLFVKTINDCIKSEKYK